MSLRSIVKKIPGASALYIALKSRGFAPGKSYEAEIKNLRSEKDALQSEKDALQQELEAVQILAHTTEIERDFAAKLLTERIHPPP